MDFHERQHLHFHESILRTPDLTRRFLGVKNFILSSLEQEYTLIQILRVVCKYRFNPPACHFSHMLCKWGLLREYVDYNPIHEDQIVINQIAQEMANDMSSKEVENLWISNPLGAHSLEVFLRNLNPLAIVLLSRAYAQYQRENHSLYRTAVLKDSTNNSISKLPRQPDRKVCMTCGERVDGVIYCSEQCRPSASLKWYSQRFNRAETQTLTEGFRTARSRFISPSADSSATRDTTQFVPPPYSLVDANPPPPKFVPVKEEPQEEEGIEEITQYSGLVDGLGWPLVRHPSLPNNSFLDPPRTIKLPPIISLSSQNNLAIKRES